MAALLSVAGAAAPPASAKTVRLARLVVLRAGFALHGTQIDGQLTVANRGGRAVRSQAALQWARAGERMRRAAVFSIPAFRAGQRQELRLSALAPAGAPSGVYRLRLCLDIRHHIQQSSRAGDCASAGKLTVPAKSSGQTGAALFTANAPVNSQALSCARASFCMAASGNGDAYAFDGRRWSATHLSSSPLISVSCPTGGFCVMTNNAGQAFTYRSGRWSAPVTIDSHSPVVSCASQSFCATSDYYGYGEIYNGAAWSSPAFIDSDYLPGSDVGSNSLSCPSETFCLAIDFANNVLTYDGERWHATLPGTNPLGPQHDAEQGGWHISCPTTSFCAALSDSGYVLTYNGQTWSQTTWLPPFRDTFTSFSCASASFCVALAINGYVYAYNGSYWYGPTAIGSGHSSVAISCPTSSFCGAITGTGHAAQWTGRTWAAGRPITPFPVPAHRVTTTQCVFHADPTGRLCSAP